MAAVARAADAVAETQLYADVEHRLFGRPRSQLRVSRYILLELVARGAFGVVYSAYDPQLDRRVAVKLLLGGGRSGDDEAKVRMVREAHALARLRHPNVVAVYDVGEYGAGEIVELDSPVVVEDPLQGAGVFIVMELVEGEPLSTWLGTPRAWPDVLARFLAAGQGLAAAHEHDLVHRDFKPANVVVEGERTLVLDFGLASRIDVEAGDPLPRSWDDSGRTSTLDSPITQAGTVMGTPRYMAPEQHDGVRATAAADQYAFAVALFEALYGCRAFAAESPQLIVEAKKRSAVTARPTRSDVPRAVYEVLMRALACDPAGRYPSMSDLLAALARAAAGPVRRRRIAAVVGLAGVAVWSGTLLVATASPCERIGDALSGVWDDPIRARSQAAFVATGLPYARRTFGSVADRLDAYTDEWVREREAACWANENVSQQHAAADAPRDLCFDRALHAVGGLGTLLVEADASVVEHAVVAAAELPDLRQCRATSPSDGGDVRAVPRREVLMIESSLARAAWSLRAARFDDARAHAGDAVASATELDYPPSLAAAHLAVATVERAAGRTVEARESAHRAIASAERAHEPVIATRALLVLVRAAIDRGEPDVAETLISLVQSRIDALPYAAGLRAELALNLGLLRTDQARDADAKTVLREGLDQAIAEFGPAHPQVAWLYNALGNVHEDAGEYDDALTCFGEAMQIWHEIAGESHPSTAVVLNNIANVEASRGNLDAGRAAYERSLAVAKTGMGPEHPFVGVVMHNLGWLAQISDRRRDAIAGYNDAIEWQQRILGADHPRTAPSLDGRGYTWLEFGKCIEAERDLLAALKIYTKAYGQEHPRVAGTLDRLAQVRRCRGEFADALDYHRRSIAAWRGSAAQDLDDVADALGSMARTHVARGDWRLAERAAREALETGSDGEHEWRSWARVALGQALLGQGRVEEALAELRPAADRLGATGRTRVAESFVALADAYARRGDEESAIEALERAWSLADRGEDSNARDLVRISMALAERLGATDRARAIESVCHALVHVGVSPESRDIRERTQARLDAWSARCPPSRSGRPD